MPFASAPRRRSPGAPSWPRLRAHRRRPVRGTRGDLRVEQPTPTAAPTSRSSSRSPTRPARVPVCGALKVDLTLSRSPAGAAGTWRSGTTSTTRSRVLPAATVFNEMDRRGTATSVAGENIGWNNASDSTRDPEDHERVHGVARSQGQHPGQGLGPHRHRGVQGSQRQPLLDRPVLGCVRSAPDAEAQAEAGADARARSPPADAPPDPEAHPQADAEAAVRARRPTLDRRARGPDRRFDTSPPRRAAASIPRPPKEPRDVGRPREPGVRRRSIRPTPESFRVTDPPVAQGLFETIVGGVAGLFLGS